MSAADLRRLIERATPRSEDVRSPDRTDIIRREHGHLTLREVLDALDALRFTAQGFVEVARDLIGGECDSAAAGEAGARLGTSTAEFCDGWTGDGDGERRPASGGGLRTAVHGLYRALSGTRVLTPAVPMPPRDASGAPVAEEAPEEGAAGWEEVVTEARRSGAQCMKDKDFAGAVLQYTAAIAAAPRSDAERHTLHSNRSAAHLQSGSLEAAIADAGRCVEIAPEWPKGHYRQGSALRQAGFLREAAAAFRRGWCLEPDNKDWEKEVIKTERLWSVAPEALAQQLVARLLPEILAAWRRGGDPQGVLHLQVNGDFEELGQPKWKLMEDGKKEMPKAQVRIAFLPRQEYKANMVENLVRPPMYQDKDAAAVVDLTGKQLRIADVTDFFAGGEGCAAVHVDIRSNATQQKLAGLVCLVPCGSDVMNFVKPLKDPPAPKGTVDAVLQIQRQSGFPRHLPRLLGFQALPGGDLNYPVIDLSRDAPGA